MLPITCWDVGRSVERGRCYSLFHTKKNGTNRIRTTSYFGSCKNIFGCCAAGCCAAGTVFLERSRVGVNFMLSCGATGAAFA